jgi:hypothetical protein
MHLHLTALGISADRGGWEPAVQLSYKSCVGGGWLPPLMLSSARKDMERATRAFNSGLLLIASLLGSVLFLVGLLTGGLVWLHTAMPASTRTLFFGTFLLLAFYPQYLLLGSCRTLLGAIRELEKRVEGSSHAA